MSVQFSYDVFLSHNAKDKPRVRRLAERLKQAGLRVWFDEWNVLSGDIIALKVDEGLEQSRVLLLCISPNALASGWVALERSTAIHRDPANADRRFIPLLLADCELPDTLRRYKYVDFRDEAEAAFEELLSACRIPTEEVSEVAPPKPAETARPTRIKRPKGKKPAEQQPAPQRKPKEKSQPKKPPEQTEPLATLERKLTGHRGWVMSIAVSPNGKLVASGSKDSTVWIWDFATGTKIYEFQSRDAVWSVAFSPDSTKVLAASVDGRLCLWNALTGELLVNMEGHSKGISSAMFMGNGDEVVSGSEDGTLRIWELPSGKCRQVLDVGGNGVRSVGVKDDVAIVGHENGTLSVWNVHTGSCEAQMKGHRKAVWSLALSTDGNVAISGSNDKTIRIWVLNAYACIGILEGHSSGLHSVALSTRSDILASAEHTTDTFGSGSWGEDVWLWNWRSANRLQIISFPPKRKNSPQQGPTSVAFSPDGKFLLIGECSTNAILVYGLHSENSPIGQSTHRYVNAKVVLLGEGTVGKTSLAHRLIEDKYVVRDRTHGMNVWRLDLPLPPDAMLEREALLWDLAGQEDYRLIHQLFLDETALALLLINPQNDDPFAEAGDWLKALKTAAGNQASQRDAARLLIFSQVDVGGMKLGNAKIERFREQYGFANWLPTSAKTGENCSDQESGGQPSKLKQLIAAHIPWDKLPWTSTPRLLAELKTAVMTMRDEQDIRLLRFAELTQRLEQALPDEKFSESDVRTAVTLLANHGLAQPLKFGDLVLLQPELLNGYAGAIIRAARAHTDEIGCVLEADIYRPGFDFTGVERLKHRPDEELLLRALVQTFLDHSLCIAEDTPQGRHLVFPSQYRREKDLPRDPDIFVSYTFSGEWQTVWTTLVVRLWYSQEFEHRELWRNAAEFASGKGHTLGLKIDNKQGEGMATISLYFDVQVEDVLKAIFIEYVHRHLAKYGCEVSRDRRYVCPNTECGKPVKDLDEVRKRIAAKKDFIYCQGCDEKVPLMDFIEQRLKSDPVAQKILAMDAIATRELDAQALEQILIGHMMAIAGEANQIFRPVTMFDHGIDGEVEFKDNDGNASGKRIYIQLKSGNSYLRTRQRDGREVFDVKNDRHLEYWVSQPVDVYLVIRQTDETSGGQTIRWMNVTRYLKARRDKQSRQIIFNGEKLDMEAVWKVRDEFFPPQRVKK